MSRNGRLEASLDRGVVRRVDGLGRVVIPKELRVLFNIKEDTPVTLAVVEDGLYLKVVQDTCIFCSSKENLFIEFKEKKVCRDCYNQLWGSEK